MPVRLPSTPTPPKRPKARPQESRGTDHHHSLYNHDTKAMAATFAGRARVKRRLHCWESRISVINPGGISGSFEEFKRGRLL
ncbi:hypothetical protein QBC46DRAFT_374312 [Diplogelasinospora grovesii]|uniref:Uncharacterized protein n=1 Tax=Diplogelasinospora grovesii TaxID=303347 RepID=A0AAN6S8Y4_9PEZI|nr:hypothetical protein QBC46DRAFT_374312 [Diplogelasinospora grovesii]